MNTLRGLARRIHAIFFVSLLLLILVSGLAWDRYKGQGKSGFDRVDYASELLAHGLPQDAVTVLQSEIDADPTSRQALRLRRVMAEVLMDKIGDHEKALAELVAIRSIDPSQASATEELVQRCMDRLGRVYDVQRRLILAEGKNPVKSQISSSTAVRLGNEEGITITEVERRLAQMGLPVKNPPKESFDKVIQGMISELLLRRAAKRAAIDRLPQFLDQVRQFEANLALQKYLEERVLKDVQVDEQALTLFMEKNKQEFDTPLRVVYSALAFVDEGAARAFVSGQPPATPPQTLVDHVNALQSELPKPLKGIQWESDPPKGPLGPVEIDGRWMVYPIHEVIPGRRVPPDLARQQARLKLLEEKQGQRVSQILGELAQKEEVKMVDETLQSYFFPDASKTAEVK